MIAVPHVGVIGAGIVGLSTAHAVLERGAAVTVYERGVPGHGQSGGESRIFRHSHEDPRLVALARRARAIWGEWEARFGIELISPDGVVAIGPSVEDRLRVLEAVGDVPVRPIDVGQVRERLPFLAPYAGPALLDEGGGSIRTGATIKALTSALGSSLVTDEVISIRPTSQGGVEVRTGGTCATYTSVLVCAGLGTSRLARQMGLSLPVRAGAHVRATFAVRGDPPARVACLQDGSGDFGEVGTYATPVPGNGAYAVGLSQAVEVREDGSLVDPAALAGLADRAIAYVRRALPALDPEPLEYRHCWVTELPWSSDGVAVWESGNTYFVAGHNLFKHAPALGRALARAALGEGLADELRPTATLGAPR